MANLTPEEKLKRMEERQKAKYNKEHKIINEIDHKICADCQDYKPATDKYFYANDKNSIDGLSNRCKECDRKRSLRNRNENIERARASWRNWYRQDGNAERVKAYNREYYEADPERKLQIAKEFRQKFPEIVNGYSQNRKHKNHNINTREWIACKDYFKNENGKWVCAYCGRTEEESYKLYNYQLHKEHAVYDGENDLSNCLPACQECNSEKHIFALDDWYNNSNPKYSEERYNKIQKWLQEDYKKYIIPLEEKKKKKYARKPKTA